MSDIQVSQFSALQVSTQLAVAWGFFWRALVTTVVSMIGGAIVGGILGFMIGIANALLGIGAAPEKVMHLAQIVGGVAGAAVGLVFFWLYVGWLFKARIAGYRLQLVADSKA